MVIIVASEFVISNAAPIVGCEMFFAELTALYFVSLLLLIPLFD